MSIDYPYFSYQLVEEDFNDPLLLTSIWGRTWGVNNAVGRIREVLVCRPNKAAISRLVGHYEAIESGPPLT